MTARAGRGGAAAKNGLELVLKSHTRCATLIARDVCLKEKRAEGLLTKMAHKIAQIPARMGADLAYFGLF